MKFTRRQVLEAIRFENLVAGDFFSLYAHQRGECEVCAVGGLLRRAGVKPLKINKTAWNLIGGQAVTVTGEGDEVQALTSKNYLLALSIKFERLAVKYGTGKRTRQKLATFVKANFPKEFKAARN